jgi:sarcosine oxidase, subunit alpha
VSRERPLLVPASPRRGLGLGHAGEPDHDAVHLRFDEALVEAQRTDTLATALIRAGVLMTSRSPKYRRPRGPFCLGGDCGTCLVRVDGRPNVRACVTPVREGMRVSSQNSYKPRRLDPTALVDTLFPGGIDHHHLMVRPRLANQLMQEFARHLTGFGELPAGVGEREHEYREHRLPVLILGAGPAGRAAAAVLTRAGVDHQLVDRHDALALAAHAELDACPAHEAIVGYDRVEILANTGVFGIYPGPKLGFPEHRDDRALVGASELAARPAEPDSAAIELERLHGFRPRHLIFALGTRDTMLPFANDDLPGVVAARGLIRALIRADARIQGRCVVVGEGPWAQQQRDRLDALRSSEAPAVELVAPAQIVRALGGDRLEALECKGRRMSCALLAVAGAPAPAHELPAQAGVALRFDGSGFVVVRAETGSERGRCGTLGGTQLWAAGDLCGWLGPAEAARDGERVAQTVVEALAASPDSLDAQHFAPGAPPQLPALRERPVVGDAFAEPRPFTGAPPKP